MMLLFISCKSGDEPSNEQRKEFLKNKQTIITEMQGYLEKEKYTLAVNIYKKKYQKYKDTELEKLFKVAQEKRAGVNAQKLIDLINKNRVKNIYYANDKARELVQKFPSDEHKKLQTEIEKEYLDKYSVKEIDLKTKSEIRKYKAELNSAQLTCNSVIPQKFPKIYKKATKNILMGYRDGELGQHGYKGSGKKVLWLPAEGVKFRWTWSIEGSGYFIKCLIMNDKTYRISMESL